MIQRGHVIDGVMTMMPCFITNTTAGTLLPYSWVEATGNTPISAIDPGMIAQDEAISAVLMTSSAPAVACSVGPVAIPPGKTAPGYIGPVMPVQGNFSVGDRVNPTAGSVAASAAADGLWRVLASREGVSIVMFSPDVSAATVDLHRIRFRTTSRMTNRAVNAVVEWTSSTMVAVGDAVVVHDHNNRFPHVDVDAQGEAFYWPVVGARPAFWAVEQVSQPITRVRAYIDSCIIQGQVQYTANVKTNNQLETVPDGQEDDWLLSGYTDTDIPEEWTLIQDGANTRYTFEAFNDLKLDAALRERASGVGSMTIGGDFVVGSTSDDINLLPVICERWTNQAASDPDNTILNKVNNQDDSPRWVITQVCKQIARNISGKVSSRSAIQLADIREKDFWDGGDPTTCTMAPGVVWGIEPPCEFTDMTQVHGTYDPENNQYRLVATDSAVLGVPEDVTHFVDYEWVGCNLQITTRNGKGWFCANQPETETKPLPTTTIDVTTPDFFIKQDGSQEFMCLPVAKLAVCNIFPGDQDDTCFQIGDCETVQ